MKNLQTSIICLAVFFHLKNCVGRENCEKDYAHFLLCLATMRKLFAFPEGCGYPSSIEKSFLHHADTQIRK